jgi:hypothetical protein
MKFAQKNLKNSNIPSTKASSIITKSSIISCDNCTPEDFTSDTECSCSTSCLVCKIELGLKCILKDGYLQQLCKVCEKPSLLGPRLKTVAEDLIKTIDTLKRENESLTSQNISLTSQNRSLTSQNISLTSQNISLTSQLEIALEKPAVTVPLENEETKLLKVKNTRMTTEIEKLKEDLQSEKIRQIETKSKLDEMTGNFEATSNEVKNLTKDRDNLKRDLQETKYILDDTKEQLLRIKNLNTIPSPLESAKATPNVASSEQRRPYEEKPLDLNEPTLPTKPSSNMPELPALKPTPMGNSSEAIAPTMVNSSEEIKKKGRELIDNAKRLMDEHSIRNFKVSGSGSNNNLSTPNSVRKQNPPNAELVESKIESKMNQSPNSVNLQKNFGTNPTNPRPTPVNTNNDTFSSPISLRIQNNPLPNLMESDASTQRNSPSQSELNYNHLQSGNSGNDYFKRKSFEEEKSTANHQYPFESSNYNTVPTSNQGGQDFNPNQQGMNMPFDDVSREVHRAVTENNIKLVAKKSTMPSQNEHPYITPGGEEILRGHQRQVSSGGLKVVNLEGTIRNLMASNVEPNKTEAKPNNTEVKPKEILHVAQKYQDLDLTESIYGFPPPK